MIQKTPAAAKAVTAKDKSPRQKWLSEAAEVLGVKSDAVYEYLRDLWVSDVPELTDQELNQGIALIAKFNLDPIAREIYVKRTPEGRTLAVVTIDGWVKILDRCDHYDGFRQLHRTDSDGDVVCIETRIYSKNRKYPAAYRAYRTEYEAIAGMWTEKMPVHMLGNFSFRHCARLFMPLGGNVVTQEEAEIIIRRQEAVGGVAGGGVAGNATATQRDGSIRENDEDPFVEDVSDSVPWEDERECDPPRTGLIPGLDLTEQDVAALFGSYSTMDGQVSAAVSVPAAQQDTQQAATATTPEVTPEAASEVTTEVATSTQSGADAERDAAFEDWMHKFGTIRAAKTADAVLTLALGARSDWTDSQCRELTMRAISAKQDVLARK